MTETEMIAAGVAARTTDGHLIDRFRDRLVLPIRDNQQDLVAFVARRHPDRNDTDGGPKYLNTPTTTLFTKADHLYGSHLAPPPHPGDSSAGSPAQGPTTVPVLVEGPLDAIAVTLASGGRHLGLSPLGTALTESQAAHLANLGQHPVVATDPDTAGRAAARRDFWLLAQHRCDPTIAALPHHLDPADVLTRHGADALRQALEQAHPLGDRLIEQLSHAAAGRPAREDALRTLAARPPHTWGRGVQMLSRRLNVPEQTLREELLPLTQEWTTQPDSAARAALTSKQTGLHARPGQDERTGRHYTQAVPVTVRRSGVPSR